MPKVRAPFLVDLRDSIRNQSQTGCRADLLNTVAYLFPSYKLDDPDDDPDDEDDDPDAEDDEDDEDDEEEDDEDGDVETWQVRSGA